ncbi:MAG: hypothetical protein ACXVHO_09040 [Methanobacterium sp.]
MASITLQIPDNLENEFRRLARIKFGDRNGKLSKGGIEALKLWCAREKGTDRT